MKTNKTKLQRTCTSALQDPVILGANASNLIPNPSETTEISS